MIFVTKKDPVGGKSELRGNLQHPSVGDTAFAPGLADCLGRNIKKFGQLTVTPQSGSLEQPIKSVGICGIHGIIRILFMYGVAFREKSGGKYGEPLPEEYSMLS